MAVDAEAGQLLCDLFPRIWVINLPERRDRRREMGRELGRIGLGLDSPGFTLFPAIRPADKANFPSVGALGCFSSHLAILEEIAAGEAPVGLIIEDDAALVPEFGTRLRALAPAIRGGGWGLFYGFYNGRSDHSWFSEGMVDCDPEDRIVTSHFMAVRRETAAKIVPYFRAMMARPLGDPAGGPMHVDGAYSWFRREHPEASWTIAAEPPLSVQRSSPSDIQDRRWFDRVPALAPLLRLGRAVKRRISG